MKKNIILVDDMAVGYVADSFGLGDKYLTLMASVVDELLSDEIMVKIDIDTAIELAILDSLPEDEEFKNALRNRYSDNYDLIPEFGIKGVLEKTLSDYVIEKLMAKKGEVLTMTAISYLIRQHSGKVVSVDIVDFFAKKDFTKYDTLNGILLTIDTVVDIYEKEASSILELDQIPSDKEIKMMSPEDLVINLLTKYYGNGII